MPVNTALANSVWTRYQHLRDNGHHDFCKKADQCVDFFVGQQWAPADLAFLKSVKRPALTINKIISTISNVLGEQIYNRTDTAFRPRNEGATNEVADALTKVFMQISDNNLLPWQRSDWFLDGVLTGRGFADVRLDFTDSLRGEIRIKRLNGKNVLIDKDAEEYDPDTWGDVITTKWLSPDDIELAYSKRDADLLRSRGNSHLPYGFDSIDENMDRFGGRSALPYPESLDADVNLTRNIRVLERQWRKLDKVEHFVDLQTYDMRMIPADWDHSRISEYLSKNPNLNTTKKLIKRIRWTVVADNIVLHDDWSPYRHFTVVPFFPYFISGRTVGLVENLIGPQELLNKTSSQELHIVNTTANSGWKVKKGSLTNMSIAELELRGAQTGLVLELNDIDGAEKITPNATPTGLDRISYKAEEHIKTISGVSDYQLGSAREDVAAKSVLANKQSGQTNLAKPMDNLNRSDYMLARNVLDIIQEYYTEQRLIMVTQDRLTNKAEPMTVNEVTPEGQILNDLTLGEYAVVITTQPERDTFEDSQFDQAVRLRTEVGVQIPDTFILQASRLKNKADIISALEGNKDSPEAQAEAQRQARAAEAEVVKVEAEGQLKMAQAAKAASEANNPNDPGSEAAIELQKLEMEYAHKDKALEMEFAHKERQLQMEMQLKREAMQQELQIKAEAEKQKAMTQRVAAVAQAQNQPATQTQEKTP